MRSPFLAPAIFSCLGVLTLLPRTFAATPWGEDPTRPTEDECSVLIDSELDANPPAEWPPTCDGSNWAEAGVDACGCWYKLYWDFDNCTPVGQQVRGRIGTYEATYFATRSWGLVNATAGDLTLTTQAEGQVAYDDAETVTRLLWRAQELGNDVGFSLPFSAAAIPVEDLGGSDKVVYWEEADSDGPSTFDSLEVHGVYFVLGDLTVSGRAEIDGLLIVTGKLEVGELVVAAQDMDGVSVAGGYVIANPIVADSVEGQDCLIYTRDVLTGRGGGIDVEGDVSVDGCFLDGGPGLTAGGDVSVRDSTVATDALGGADVRLDGSSVSRLAELDADTLVVADSQIDGGGRLVASVAHGASFVASSVGADGFALTADTLEVDGSTNLVARHRDDSGVVLPVDPDESGATGLYLEQVWGASFGGYGGTEGWINDNAFRPSEAPSGDPRDPSGHGVDGWALSWADTTYGGGGGNDLDLRILGAATIDGTLDANGGSAPVGPLGGGGSGGSGGVIRIDAGTLGGSALLHANGGDGALQAEGNSVGLAGGGGSGGRIAVTAREFDGLDFQYEAVGGEGALLEGWLPDVEEPIAWHDWRVHGGPGTVYEKADDAFGRLLIDGNGLDPASWGCPASGPECRGAGLLPSTLPDTDVFVSDATVQVGALDARSLTLENALLLPDDPRVRLPWPPPTLLVDGGLTSAQLFLPARVYADPLDERVSLTLDTDLVIDAGSAIVLSGFGGYSRTTPEGVEDERCWNGGSHGGRGGGGKPGSMPDTTPEEPYDDAAAPTEPGRGGCSDEGWTALEQPWCGLGGVGGAVLRLVAGGTVQVDGVIDATGYGGRPETTDMYCIADLGNAGGAGGAIWLTAASLAGAGALDASGGAGATNLDGGLCGGGGRIAVEAGVAGFSGQARVDGGAAGCPDVSSPGEEGTVHIDTGTPPDGDDTGKDDTGTPADKPDASGGPCACGTGGARAGGLALLLGGIAASLRRRRRA